MKTMGGRQQRFRSVMTWLFAMAEWKSLLTECELPLEVPILEYLASMNVSSKRFLEVNLPPVNGHTTFS